MVDKVKTGIDGLDAALNGGIPFGNVVLVSGGAGTGKSTLCLQYLLNGCLKFGEKGLYISTEQSRTELLKTAESFKWDIVGLEKKGLFKIAYFDVVETDGFLEKIYELYTTFKPKRVVIDSLTTLTDSLLVTGLDDVSAYSMVKVAKSVSPIPRTERMVSKNLLYHLMKKLRLFESTILLTSELLEKSDGLSADEISEFICDGVFIIELISGWGKGSLRNIRVRKMRYTNHVTKSLPLNITEKGISVSSSDKSESDDISL